MAVNLKKAKEGNLFTTKGGDVLRYWFKDQGLHRLVDVVNNEAYWYDEDGYCEALGNDGELIEQIISLPQDIQNRIEEKRLKSATKSQEAAKEAPKTALSSLNPTPIVVEEIKTGMESTLNILAIVEMIAAVIIFFVLLSDQFGIAIGILAYGIIQLIITLVFTEMSVNVKKNNRMIKIILSKLR